MRKLIIHVQWKYIFKIKYSRVAKYIISTYYQSRLSSISIILWWHLTAIYCHISASRKLEPRISNMEVKHHYYNFLTKVPRSLIQNLLMLTVNAVGTAYIFDFLVWKKKQPIEKAGSQKQRTLFNNLTSKRKHTRVISGGTSALHTLKEILLYIPEKKVGDRIGYTAYYFNKCIGHQYITLYTYVTKIDAGLMYLYDLQYVSWWLCR